MGHNKRMREMWEEIHSKEITTPISLAGIQHVGEQGLAAVIIALAFFVRGSKQL